MCFRLSVLLAFSFMFSVSVFGSNQKQKEQCPTMCICDIYMDLNRANCSNENLIGANIGMSSYVEILDFSYNDITIIDRECFPHLKHLTTLSLHKNAINYIELDAFANLEKLLAIDLSYNRLESFDNRIFEQNLQLLRLNLTENKFMNLPNEPIVKSLSLQVLDLQRTKLTHLHIRIFEELPNIKSIDLSGNLLIILNLEAFVQNSKLRKLNIQSNPIPCNGQLEMSLIWLKRTRVKVLQPSCSQTKPSTKSTFHMFERIQALPASTTTKPIGQKISSKSNDLNLIWNIVPMINQICPVNNTNRACALLEMCTTNFTALFRDVEKKFAHKNEVNVEVSLHHTWMQFVTINIAFYAGLGIGTIFGGLIVYLIAIIVQKCFVQHKNGEERMVRSNRIERNQRTAILREINSNNQVRTLHNSDEQPSSARMIEATPVSRDFVVPQTRELLQYDPQQQRHEPSNSFFSLFFERPARRRYYRQLNRSATNLVRRLSQSRLFVNSSRAQNANYRNGFVRTQSNVPAETDVNAPESSINYEENEENISLRSTVVRSTSLPSINLENVSHAETMSVVSDIEIYERVETPPPAYKDIAIDK